MNRYILDAIGSTQEGLHSVKFKKLPGLVMKLDLVKAYDRVYWVVIRLLLLQIIFPLYITDWIMGYVTLENVSILLNGTLTQFFKSSKEIQQGCPLSPFLLLLVVERLSLILNKETRECKIKGIQVSMRFRLIHMLFFYGIPLFGHGYVE